MLWYEALFLGLVQGLTEFLPVSSSGHLVLVPKILGWNSQPLAFDVVLHLGTTIALIFYFWQDLVKILRGFFSDLISYKFNFSKYGFDALIGWYILLGSVPALIFGVFLGSYIENTFRSILSVAIFLIAGSFLLLFAELFWSKKSHLSDETDEKSQSSMKSLSSKKAFVIGIFQSFALFPGISRSGATISGGIFSGLSRAQSARFSFLLSMPVIVGASLFKIIETFNTDLVAVGVLPLVIGFFSSLLVGLFAIDFLLKFLKSRSLYVFIVYRLALAFVLIFVYLL